MCKQLFHTESCLFLAVNGCTVINNCVSSPCQHGGSCSTGINFFHCACSPSYTGTACEQGGVYHYCSLICIHVCSYMYTAVLSDDNTVAHTENVNNKYCTSITCVSNSSVPSVAIPSLLCSRACRNIIYMCIALGLYTVQTYFFNHLIVSILIFIKNENVKVSHQNVTFCFYLCM